MTKPVPTPSNCGYYPSFTPQVHFLSLAHTDLILEEERKKRPMLDLFLRESKNTLMDIHGICAQAQNGLRIMAINNQWPEHDKIEKVDLEKIYNAPLVSFMNQSPELRMSYELVNKTIDVYREYRKLSASTSPKDIMDSFKYVSALPYSRTAGFMAIMDAQEKLKDRGLTLAAAHLENYTDSEKGLEREYSYHEAYIRFMEHPNLKPRP